MFLWHLGGYGHLTSSGTLVGWGDLGISTQAIYDMYLNVVFVLVDKCPVRVGMDPYDEAPVAF